MLELPGVLALYLSQYSTITAISAVILLYIAYYFLMRYCTVRMWGDYDRSKKNMGKTLPPYPNGWFIACKSK